MKVKINGCVSKEALKTILNNQKDKIKIIDEFCKQENIDDFYYCDNELEYEIQSKPVKNKNLKNIEVRKDESEEGN